METIEILVGFESLSHFQTLLFVERVSREVYMNQLSVISDDAAERSTGILVISNEIPTDIEHPQCLVSVNGLQNLPSSFTLYFVPLEINLLKTVIRDEERNTRGCPTGNSISTEVENLNALVLHESSA